MKNSVPIVAIVDVADSDHGRLMQRCAHFQGFSPEIRWIEPCLALPEILAPLAEVAAVAIPIAVKGATLRDRFTQRLMTAIKELRARGIPVFVAAGNHRPNLLAQAGVVVPATAFPGSVGTSEACVRAAVRSVFRSMGNPSQGR